jgi:hypothetical protein
MGLMILISSLASALVGFIAFNIRRIRDVEQIIPDADPRTRLADYRKRLFRAFKTGKLTRAEAEILYKEQRSQLFPK